MKTVIKNLWNRRHANAWLFIELIIVSYLAMAITDRVAVSLHDINMPLGFDIDRLVVVEIKKQPEDARGYDAAADSLDVHIRSIRDIEAMLMAREGVENLTNMYGSAMPCGSSNSFNMAKTGNLAVDTVVKAVNSFMYAPGTHFFETFGIKVVEGAPDAETLSEIPMDRENDVIITEDLAKLIAPGQPGTSVKLINKVNEETGDTTFRSVRGVVSGMRWSTLMRSYCLMFYPLEENYKDSAYNLYQIVVRLRPGTDPGAWAKKLHNEAASVSIGNLYLASATPYTAYAKATEDTYGVTNDRLMDYALAVFFVLNLMLGTIGCFWLQTRKRVGEIGVRRSFGARRGSIVRMLLSESWILASVAFIIGCLIQLQMLIGSTDVWGFTNNKAVNLADTWVNNFWQHFLIVSAITYGVIIVSVLIGTIIPAIHASRVDVTDALRDE